MNRYSWSGAFALLCLAILLTWLVALIRGYVRARRADRQVEDHIRMGRGMRYAARRGWLPEDTQ